jgi:hypothetical protein
MRPTGVSLSDYAHSLFIPWDNAIIFFWFLPTLLLCFLIAPFLPRDRDSITRDVLLFVCGVSLWFLFPHVNQHGYLSILNIGGALHNAFFFLTGFLTCKYGFSSGRYSGSLALAALTCSVFLFGLLREVKLAQLILAFLGLVFSYSLIRAAQMRWFTEVMADIGGYSFQIYLLSWSPMVIVRIVCNQMMALNIWSTVMLSAICGLLVPIAATRLFDRIVPARTRFVYGR